MISAITTNIKGLRLRKSDYANDSGTNVRARVSATADSLADDEGAAADWVTGQETSPYWSHPVDQGSSPYLAN